MTSVFDLATQHQDVGSKIVVGLERLAQAFRVLLWEEAKEHALSPIQIQFLVYLRYHPPEFCRVSLLAKEFGLTQATVSDAVTSLEAKGLIVREPAWQDKRILTLRLTPTGDQLATKLAAWAAVIKEQLGQFSNEEQLLLMQFLMHLIESLQRAGLIAVSRMCLTCRFFQADAHPDSAAPHHCRLLDKPLANSDLRLDCLEHELALN